MNGKTKALKKLEKDKTKGGIGELTHMSGEPVYRYMKPLYMEMQCLMCHSDSESMPSQVKEFIEKNYATDNSFGYHAGDLRGGISVIIPLKDEYAFDFLAKK